MEEMGREAGGRKKFKPLVIGVVLILALISIVRLVSHARQKVVSAEKARAVSEQLEEKETELVLVKVAPIKKEDFEDTLPVMGSVRGYVELDLKFGINGVIETFNFKDGDKVEKGQLIASLEQKDALVRYNYAKLKREEFEKLYEIGALVESKLEQVKLEEELARIELEKTELKAPFDGVINNREAETGKFVTINDKVATFSSIDEVVAEVGIIEKDIEKVKLGQRALLKVDAYPNIEFEGIVNNISSSFEGKSRTLTARVKVPNPKRLLLPGMFARAVIYIYAQKDALVIPSVALERREGEYFVFVADKEGKARERKVGIAYLSSEKAVVESGLEENESVVVERSGELHDEDQIKVVTD